MMNIDFRTMICSLKLYTTMILYMLRVEISSIIIYQ